MFRIDSQGTVPALPAPDPAGQLAGFFSKGNPAVGQKATVVSADWANAMQEEICYVIEQAGIQLNQQTKTNHVQLKQAIVSLIGVVAPAPHTHDASDIVSGTFADARIAASNVTQYQGLLALNASQIVAGQFANARISQSSVTQYQGALQIDASQVVSGTFLTARIPGLDASQITSGTFANARIAQSNVTQYQGALSLSAGQITSGTFADARIAASNVTQWQAALSINPSQLTPGTIASFITFSNITQFNNNISMQAGRTVDGIDISAHRHTTTVSFSNYWTKWAFQNQNASQDITNTVGGYTGSDFVYFSISDIVDVSGGIDADNKYEIGGTGTFVVGGITFLTAPNYSGGNWNFRMKSSAGNEMQGVAFGYGVLSRSASFNSGTPF